MRFPALSLLSCALMLLCTAVVSTPAQAQAAAPAPDLAPPRVQPQAVNPQPASAPPEAAQARARSAAPPPQGSAPAAPANEPAVKRNVVEDDNARIEELNVRGAVRSITVKPKGPIDAEYEVLPTDASRDPTEGPGSTKGAQGRRVWRVLSF